MTASPEEYKNITEDSSVQFLVVVGAPGARGSSCPFIPLLGRRFWPRSSSTPVAWLLLVLLVVRHFALCSLRLHGRYGPQGHEYRWLVLLVMMHLALCPL